MEVLRAFLQIKMNALIIRNKLKNRKKLKLTIRQNVKLNLEMIPGILNLVSVKLKFSLPQIIIKIH